MSLYNAVLNHERKVAESFAASVINRFLNPQKMFEQMYQQAGASSPKHMMAFCNSDLSKRPDLGQQGMTITLIDEDNNRFPVQLDNPLAFHQAMILTSQYRGRERMFQSGLEYARKMPLVKSAQELGTRPPTKDEIIAVDELVCRECNAIAKGRGIHYKFAAREMPVKYTFIREGISFFQQLLLQEGKAETYYDAAVNAFEGMSGYAAAAIRMLEAETAYYHELGIQFPRTKETIEMTCRARKEAIEKDIEQIFCRDNGR